MLVRLFLVMAGVILISCSPEFHIRRAVKKNPSLFDTTTVRKVDIRTIHMDNYSFTEHRPPVLDTLTLIQVNAQGKEIIIKYVDRVDSIYMDVDCPDPEVVTITDTNTVFVPVTMTFFEKVKFFLKWIFVIIIGGFTVYTILKIAIPLIKGF